jgi:hypothetical protein
LAFKSLVNIFETMWILTSQKIVIKIFFYILKATEEKSKTRIRILVVRSRGSGFVSKRYESGIDYGTVLDCFNWFADLKIAL